MRFLRVGWGGGHGKRWVMTERLKARKHYFFSSFSQVENKYWDFCWRRINIGPAESRRAKKRAGEKENAMRFEKRVSPSLRFYLTIFFLSFSSSLEILGTTRERVLYKWSRCGCHRRLLISRTRVWRRGQIGHLRPAATSNLHMQHASQSHRAFHNRRHRLAPGQHEAKKKGRERVEEEKKWQQTGHSLLALRRCRQHCLPVIKNSNHSTSSTQAPPSF